MALVVLALVLVACGGGEENWPGVTTTSDNDRLYISYKEQIVSLDAEKERLWTYDGDDKFFAPVVIRDGRLYVGDYEGRIHAIDQESGDRIWLYEPERDSFMGFEFGAVDRVLGSVALNDERLFFGDEHGVSALYIADLEDGATPELDWSFETGHSVWAQPLYLDQESEICPDLDIAPTLFVASLDQKVYALDPEEGTERWSTDMGGGLPGGLTLDCERSRLYVGTLNGEVIALDLDGEIVDRYETESWVWGKPVLFNDSMLYFADLEGWLYEVELVDEGFGEVNKRRLSEESLRASPLIVEDAAGDPVLVIGDKEGEVYALDLNEPNWISDRDVKVRWRKNIDNKALTDLVWLDGEEGQLVIIGGEEEDRLVVALRLEDGGDRAWSYKYGD
ncbi:MAG: PQQ-binding-like beta-propeller repeat protein [Chloroflexi bacterium]|nr:PQQ-binding-like beta-propeller repeat protein [Chloroflexota bacterium]